MLKTAFCKDITIQKLQFRNYKLFATEILKLRYLEYKINETFKTPKSIYVIQMLYFRVQLLGAISKQLC